MAGAPAEEVHRGRRRSGGHGEMEMSSVRRGGTAPAEGDGGTEKGRGRQAALQASEAVVRACCCILIRAWPRVRPSYATGGRGVPAGAGLRQREDAVAIMSSSSRLSSSIDGRGTNAAVMMMPTRSMVAVAAAGGVCGVPVNGRRRRRHLRRPAPSRSRPRYVHACAVGDARMARFAPWLRPASRPARSHNTIERIVL